MVKARPLSNVCSGCGMNGVTTGCARGTACFMTGSTSIGVLQSDVRFNGGEIPGRQTTAMLRIGAGRQRSERA